MCGKYDWRTTWEKGTGRTSNVWRKHADRVLGRMVLGTEDQRSEVGRRTGITGCQELTIWFAMSFGPISQRHFLVRRNRERRLPWCCRFVPPRPCPCPLPLCPPTVFRALCMCMCVCMKVTAHVIKTYWRLNRLHSSRLRAQHEAAAVAAAAAEQRAAMALHAATSGMES